MERRDLPIGLRLLLLDVLLEPPVPEWLTEEDWAWIEREVREVVLLLLETKGAGSLGAAPR